MKALQMAEAIHAALAGDPEAEVTGLAAPDDADPTHATVIFRDAPPGMATRAAVVVASEDYPVNSAQAVLRVPEPRIALAVLSRLFCPPVTAFSGRHPASWIAADADVHDSATVGAHCVVESGACIGPETVLVSGVHIGTGVRVGAQCVLYPGVVLYPGTTLEDRVTVHANTAIGTDGFSFVTEAPDHPKVYSLGRVSIGSEVEIGSHCGIQRGTLGPTVVGRGTKIGGHVIVGHNCRIGEYCLFVGSTAIGGSTTFGNRVKVAGAVSVRDHVTIGDGATVMLAAVVVRDVPPGAAVLGNPAQDQQVEKRRYKALSQLAAFAQAILDVVGGKP